MGKRTGGGGEGGKERPRAGFARVDKNDKKKGEKSEVADKEGPGDPFVVSKKRKHGRSVASLINPIKQRPA